jgi:chitinase
MDHYIMRRPFIQLVLLFLAVQVNAQDRTASEPLLLGYYAGNGEGLEEYRIEQLTHLIWCFGHVHNDSMVIADAQVPVIERMVAFKQRNPKLKVLLSFGGWGGCANCSETFSRKKGRSTFAASVLALLQRHKVDGIDLDWEYPAVQGPPGHAWSPDDRGNFIELVRELRHVLGSGYEISFAAGGTDECLRAFDYREVMPLVDRMHVMSYDLVHGYSTRTGHHTPLRSSPGQVLSADHAVHLLDSLGVPRDRIVIGAAFYARVFKDVPPENDGLFQPGVFSHTVAAHSMSYNITPANGWQVHRDNDAEARYAYNAAQRQFITFDDVISVAAKANYVKSQGLGGIMFWQLSDDRKEGGLLNATYRALRAK